MKSHIALTTFALLLIVGCGGNHNNEQGSADENRASTAAGESSAFGGYLSALDKAKASQNAVNERQTRMEESLGYDPSIETRQTLGMSETSRQPRETYSEDDGMFGDMHKSMNKARTSRDMLNDRQRQMDSLAGGDL